MKKPYFELQLIAMFFSPPALAATHPEALLLIDGGLVVFPVDFLEPGSQARSAVDENLFAEINIPYQTDTGAYTFICHIFGLANNQQPAISEILLLQEVAPEILAHYRDRFLPAGEVETD